MMFKNRLGSNKRSIANQFAIMTSFVVFVTVICFAMYNIMIMNKLIQVTRLNFELNSKTFIDVIADTIKNAEQTGGIIDYKKLIYRYTNNNIIDYIIVIDKKTKNCAYSSIPELDKMANIDSVKINKATNRINALSKILISYRSTPRHNIIIGYTLLSDIDGYTDLLFENNKVLALTFIFLGIVAAFIMSRVATKPIKMLCNGVNEFSNGNLTYKITPSKYMEINELIDAFNDMSNKLNDMYTSLEQQVKDRTNEIVQKRNELEVAYKELKETQSIMVHNEKMRSLGELVAGITHEINNPVNFVYGNLIYLQEYSNKLIDIIDEYQKFDEFLSEEQRQTISSIKTELELDYIKEDLPELLRSCKDGTERTKDIILDLKSFSRQDEMRIKEIDIHKEIDLCLNILHGKYKNKLSINKEYGNLPFVESYGGQLNQVFMNILDNACFAVKNNGNVYIRTRQVDEKIQIEFEDTGTGISKEHIKKIFDPFFTTKGVGEGTGLGMSISYKIIKNHNGIIDVQSEEGKGTKFTITIPYNGLKEFKSEVTA